MSAVLLIETLSGEEHPDWYVLGSEHDAKLISMCGMLRQVLAPDERHFRPDCLGEWRAMFSRESWPGRFPDRPMRALECLEDDQYWLLIHTPPLWGPMAP